MPRGDKSAYSSKQKRQAEHIEDGYKKRGVSSKTAAKRAWATVNKETGGAKGKEAAKKTGKRASTKKSAGRKKTRSKK
jgi:plasmid stabilization system protein ParE